MRHERRNVPVVPCGDSGPPGEAPVPGGVQPRERGRHPAGGKLDPRLQHEQLAVSHHLGRVGYQGVQVDQINLNFVKYFLGGFTRTRLSHSLKESATL